jgi:hypothetical protein
MKYHIRVGGGLAPHILNLVIMWKSMVSYMPLVPRRFQIRSERFEGQKILLILEGIETKYLGHPERNEDTIRSYI